MGAVPRVRIRSMYCPKCGDGLVETEGTYVCVRGEMELSRHLADRLRASFVSEPEIPEEPAERNEIRYRVSLYGMRFCPGCGVHSVKKSPFDLRCPRCERSLSPFIYELTEFHPHR